MSGRLTGTKRFNRKFRIRTLPGSYQILHKSCRLEHRHRPRSNGTYSHAKQSNHANHSSSTNNSLQSNSKNSRPPHWPGFNSATIQPKKWDSNETESGGTDAIGGPIHNRWGISPLRYTYVPFDENEYTSTRVRFSLIHERPCRILCIRLHE